MRGEACWSVVGRMVDDEFSAEGLWLHGILDGGMLELVLPIELYTGAVWCDGMLDEGLVEGLLPFKALFGRAWRKSDLDCFPRETR